MTHQRTWLTLSQEDALRALDSCIEESPNFSHILQVFLSEERNPLGLSLSENARYYLADYFQSRSGAYCNLVRELFTDENAALNAYFDNADTPEAKQLRRERLQHIDFEQLPADTLAALFESLSDGSAVHSRMYGGNPRFKAALAALNYSLLRSGALPKEYDDISIDALLAAVFAMTDVLAVLSTVKEQQTSFTVTNKLLRAAYIGFLLIAEEGALDPSLPDEPVQMLTDKAMLHSAFLLTAKLLPGQLRMMRDFPLLTSKLQAGIVSSAAALTGIAQMQKVEGEAKAKDETAVRTTPVSQRVQDEERERPD